MSIGRTRRSKGEVAQMKYAWYSNTLGKLKCIIKLKQFIFLFFFRKKGRLLSFNTSRATRNFFEDSFHRGVQRNEIYSIRSAVLSKRHQLNSRRTTTTHKSFTICELSCKSTRVLRRSGVFLLLFSSRLTWHSPVVSHCMYFRANWRSTRLGVSI